jgi:hypothetical protein
MSLSLLAVQAGSCRACVVCVAARKMLDRAPWRCFVRNKLGKIRPCCPKGASAE